MHTSKRVFCLTICAVLIACGGSAPSSNTPATAASSPAADTPIVWTPVPAAPGAVTVVSPDSSIESGAVVTFGQTFPVGEVPAGQFVQASQGGTNLPTQTVIKRRHADNSIRHAILSVRLPSATASAPAKASVALALAASGSNATGTVLTLADVTGSSSPDYRVEIVEKSVLKDGTTAAPESGFTFATNLKAALGGTSDSWLSGPLTMEWRARVAPVATTGGQGAHNGLRVLFDARYQSANQGRVSIAMENVESNTARGDRVYDLRIYRITGGSSELVFERADIKHYAHTRYRKIFHFGAGSKEMLAIADSARLKSSRTIPNYANITIPEDTLTARYAEWQNSPRDLYQPGTMQPGMGTTGGRDDIGPLPGWTARAMVSGDPRMYQIMLDYAERAGYWNMHWRDSLKNGATLSNAGIFSIDDHPNFSLVNPTYGTDSYVGSVHYNWQGDSLPPPVLPLTTPVGYQVDDAHHPSLIYLPYIVTGDRFYLDELYFWAGWYLISAGYPYRGNDKGWYEGSNTRQMAWKLRTGGHAAWIAPDGDWQQTYFTTKLNNNFDWYRATVLPSNPLGYWTGWSGFASYELPHSPGGVSDSQSPWQHDFMAYTLFELCERGYAATDIRDFALGFTVKRFTSGADFDRLDGATYRLPARLANTTTFTTMAQLNYYAFGGKSYAERNPGSPTRLSAYNDPNGYVSMSLAALAAAVDAAGNNQALPSSGYVWVRDQAMNAGNGNSDRAGFVSNPTWNIVPRNAVIGLSEAPGIYTK